MASVPATVMSITILCPNLRCRTVLTVPDGVRGKKVRCSHCGTAFLIPPTSTKPGPSKAKPKDAPAETGKDAKGTVTSK